MMRNRVVPPLSLGVKNEGDFYQLSLSPHLLARGRRSSRRFWGIEDDGATRWKKLSFLNRSTWNKAFLKVTLDCDVNEK